MKVLTVKTIEKIPPPVQRDIHYLFQMEHHTEHIFRDKNAPFYSATISIENPKAVIRLIREKSVEIPEYTIVIEDLDMDADRFERIIIQGGKVKKRSRGTLTFDQ